MNVRIGIAVLLVVLFPVVTYAQTPSYAQSSNEESVHGRIASIPGKFDLTVRDDRGYIDNVHLHPGTIITPIGLTLVAGMTVTIIGANHGKIFAANEVDTPYRSSDEYAPHVPPPVYEDESAPPYWDKNIGPLHEGRCGTYYEHGKRRDDGDHGDSQHSSYKRGSVTTISQFRNARRGHKSTRRNRRFYATKSGRPQPLARSVARGNTVL